MKIKEGYAKRIDESNTVYMIERFKGEGKLFAVEHIAGDVRHGRYVTSDLWIQVYQLEFFDVIHYPKRKR